MATDKVMITISGLKDHEVTLESDAQPGKALYHTDSLHIDNGVPGTPECMATQLPSMAAATPPEAAGAALEGKAPWEQASGDPTAINFRPDMPLHAKMEWVCENVPRMSRLRILREGAALLCDQLIAKHYRHHE